MKKHLFFDDKYLFVRENVERRYGNPALCSTYYDGLVSTDFPQVFVFRTEDGKYRLLYGGKSADFEGIKLFSAISENGINFVPEKRNEKGIPHEIIQEGLYEDGKYVELANIYEDKNAPLQERYKLLATEADFDNLLINDTLYTSPDLFCWTKKEGVFWGDGAEPLTGVFYNSHSDCYTIVERPFWGVRRVGYKETKDWTNCTTFQNCLNVDSLDEPLSEIYGMYAFPYADMYVGIPHLYRNLQSEYNAKYHNGTIDTQLAYSYDGRYWQRSLREPFISGLFPEKHGDDRTRNLIWVMQMNEDANGDILFYAASSELEHGPAFSNPGTGRILVYKLRRDGFVCLASKDSEKPSLVATREMAWHGGEAHYNLCAKNATVAVRVSDESENVSGNVLGISRPLEGYGHEDCIPFSGDSKDWVPEFRNGKKLDDLKGKTIIVELKFIDGEVYSLYGDYTNLFNTEAARYRKYGTLPQ